MATLKFRAGRRAMIGSSRPLAAPKGSYRVIGALPIIEGRTQYRIKGEMEPYERVADEASLEAADFLD